MADFEKIEKEATDAAQTHSAQVDEAVGKAEQETDQRLGGAHSDEVTAAGSAAEKALGVQEAQQSGGQADPPAES